MTHTHASVTLHHVHGGSVRGIVPRGLSLKSSNWLVIPLVAELHSVGPMAIDGSLPVAEWEARFGTQLEHLLWVERMLDIDLFAHAHLPRPEST